MSIIDLMTLGFLNIRPMHGYDMITFAKTIGADQWGGVKTASIYKSLARLEKKEFVTSVKEVEGNNPTKKVYSSTEEGIKYFRKLIKSILLDENRVITDFSLGVSFLHRSMTKKCFLEILDKKILWLNTKNNCNNDKNEQQREQFPFYGIILSEQGEKHGAIELETLYKLKEETLEKKNNIHFLTDKEDYTYQPIEKKK